MRPRAGRTKGLKADRKYEKKKKLTGRRTEVRIIQVLSHAGRETNPH